MSSEKTIVYSTQLAGRTTDMGLKQPQENIWRNTVLGLHKSNPSGDRGNSENIPGTSEAADVSARLCPGVSL